MTFNTLGTKTQQELLLDHFRVKSSISDLEARAVYKIRALPRRISDLEELGYRFHRERRTDPSGQRYVRYFFRGAPCPSSSGADTTPTAET